LIEKVVLFVPFDRAFCHIFQVEPVEVGEPAVPAPCREMAATDGKVMGTGRPAVPAGCIGNEVPEIKAADLCETTFLCDLLSPWDKNPGSTTVIADDLGLVRDGLDDLIRLLVAVVAGRPVSRENEPVRHA
jgi:hypothetical protein